jgi:hemolysin activation/secretion protein
LLEPSRAAPSLPPPGETAPLTLPAAPPAASFDKSIRLAPAGFRFAGNTVFGDAELAAAVAGYAGKPTDMEGLAKAASAVRQYYRDRGYILTEAYLPAQKFAESGGTVLIQVLEARVGRAGVKLESGGVSGSLASAIVAQQLPQGAHITEALLEKPVLLLRDLAGYEAGATVEPGAQAGEADVTVFVKSDGKRFSGLMGLDNHGVRPAGQARAFGEVSASNLLGDGDVLTARAQMSSHGGSQLYRLGYSVTAGGHATRLGVSLGHAEYALGKQFAALGATGQAQLLNLSVSQPLVRTRSRNLFATAAVEHLELKDRTTTPAASASQRIHGARVGLAGNFTDSVGADAFNGYSLNLAHGRLSMDAASLAADQGAGGLRTAGSFSKLNLEYQRMMFVSPQGRLSATLQAQLASKNLASAEKIGLGGPKGVRGYPVGEALGDNGVIVNIEYRHQLPDFGTKVPLFASVFYDWGRVKFNASGAPFAGQASETLSAAGIGFSAGAAGNYLFSTQLAWRTDSTRPATDSDRRPRIWVSFQKWL